MPKITNKKIFSGFTLVEMILYIALVAVFLTGIVYFTWDVIYGREKAYHKQVVGQSARIALEKIAYQIRRAKEIVSISNSQLVLSDGTSQTTLSLDSGVIYLSSDGGGPDKLTSNQVIVTNLSFTDLSSSLTDPSGLDSVNIQVNLSLEQSQSAVYGQKKSSTTLVEAVELNSQYNQSRSLLADLSESNLLQNSSIQGITIQNTANENIIIETMSLSWEGATGSQNITEIQIGGGLIEWSGSAQSGQIIDINDFTLTSSDGIVGINYINFDSDMSQAMIKLKLIFADRSISKSSLSFISNLTPTPTQIPTSTPTPSYTTCNGYCLSLGYSSGICRKSAQECTKFTEVYQAGGDRFCLGGPNADSCCCKP